MVRQLSILKNSTLGASAQNGDRGKKASPPHTTTAKITVRLQNKYHSASSGNQAVWKSDNQGFKEATFIQMGRRGEEALRFRVAWRGGGIGGPTLTCGGQKLEGIPWSKRS